MKNKDISYYIILEILDQCNNREEAATSYYNVKLSQQREMPLLGKHATITRQKRREKCH